jgi:hypothetical protein
MNVVRRAVFAALGMAAVAACSPDTTAPDLAQSPVVLASATSATGATIITEAEIVRQAENTAPTGAWVLYTRTAASSGAFRVGPGTAPEGVGSLELATPGSGDKVYLFNYEYVGTPLDGLTALRYATYRSAGALQQVTAINIQADVNGAAEGGFTTLVFEPVYNTPQGAVVNGVWQTWDALAAGAGRWWSTRDIPGVCAFDCFVAWSDILAANPDATVLGAIGLNQGSGNGGLTAAADQLVIGTTAGTTTFDFDPFVTPSTRETCQHDGWVTARRADGTAFTNQGDCVAYVQTGK